MIRSNKHKTNLEAVLYFFFLGATSTAAFTELSQSSILKGMLLPCLPYRWGWRLLHKNNHKLPFIFLVEDVDAYNISFTFKLDVIHEPLKLLESSNTTFINDQGQRSTIRSKFLT